MKVVYVAGPFRAGVLGSTDHRAQDSWGIQTNVMAAMKLALDVWRLGAVALCPHSNTMFFQNAAGTADDVWLKGDLELLRRSDAVLMTPDWHRSSGAIAERKFAEDSGIPVFETVDTLRDWLAVSVAA